MASLLIDPQAVDSGQRYQHSANGQRVDVVRVDWVAGLVVYRTARLEKKRPIVQFCKTFKPLPGLQPGAR